MSICCSTYGTYAFTGCVLCAPWPETEPTTLVYQDAALTKWAAWPGLHCQPSLHRCQRKTQLYVHRSKDPVSFWGLKAWLRKTHVYKGRDRVLLHIPSERWISLLFREAGLVAAALLSICSFKNYNHLSSTYQWAVITCGTAGTKTPVGSTGDK